MHGDPKIYLGPEFVELKTKPNTSWGGWVWRQPRLLGEFLSQLLERRQESHCAQGAGFSPQATCAQSAWHVPCAGSGTDVPRGRCQGGMNGAHLQVGTIACRCPRRHVAAAKGLDAEEAQMPIRTASLCQDASVCHSHFLPRWLSMSFIPKCLIP